MINVSLLLYWLLQMGVAFLSTITFAIIFHTPRKEWLCCGFTGAVGWLVYVVCVHFGLDVATASFFATLALAWFARVFAFWRKAPVTVFLITGIFPLVPGAGIYYTGYHLFMSDNSLALDKGLETIKIAVAIALGIGIVLSLPPFLFAPRKGQKEGAHAQGRSDHWEKRRGPAAGQVPDQELPQPSPIHAVQGHPEKGHQDQRQAV